MSNKIMSTTKTTDLLHQNNIMKSLKALKESFQDSDYNPSQRDDDGNTALHCAAIEGNMAVVRFLLEECHIHRLSLNRHQHSLLHLAAAHGHLELVHYLMMDKHLHPLSPDIHGWTPVHYAIAAGHLDVVKLFSEREEVLESLKTSVIKNKEIYYNILHIAICTQNMTLTKVLLSYGYGGCTDSLSLLLSVTNSTVLQHLIENIDFNITSKRLATFAAVHCGDLESTVCLTRQFHNYGADSERNSLLHVAAHNGHLSIVHFLTEDLKIQPYARGQLYRTPIHCASINGHIDIVKFLAGDPLTDPFPGDEYNNTPLHYAAAYGHFSVLKYFISDLHLNPNVRGNSNRTLLHLASMNGNIDMVKFLTDHPFTDPVARDGYNNTPIHCAAGNGHLSVVKYFINELNCDANIRGKHYRTPLHCASVKGHTEIIKFLLDSNLTDTMARDEDNNTPFHLAALYEQVHVFRFFFQHLNNCDPNIRGELGWRPLQMACASGDLDLIKYLVEELNCSPSMEDEESPLVIAERNGNDDVVIYFLENFPSILDTNKLSQISSGMQNLSIDSSISNETEEQSSSGKLQHHKVGKSISNILYELSTSDNTLNPLIINEEKHNIHYTFGDELHKYTQ